MGPTTDPVSILHKSVADCYRLQGYTQFFLFLLKNIDYGYSLEPPHRYGSNEYTQSIF